MITGHGIDSKIVYHAWEAISQFFDQPFEVKKQAQSTDQAKYPFGYHAVGTENLSAGKKKEKEISGSISSPGEKISSF